LSVPSLCLVVLDGWGEAPPGPGNAIGQAKTPFFDSLRDRYPLTTLDACGPAVGLPAGQMGNSEVGHLNLGAGAVVEQDLVRIDEAIADGSFFENPVLLEACERARSAPRGRLHLIGLVSDGGVHSGWKHVEASIELAARERVPELAFHVLTDGRDTLPRSSPGYVERVEEWLGDGARIATVGGRYYGMDRDRRWQRLQLAYDAIAHGRGARARSALEAIRAAHDRDETDEFIRPTVIGDYEGISEGDAILHFNFRPDRARELTMALGEPEFDEFDRGETPTVHLATMTSYRAGWAYPVAFAPVEPEVTLAGVISAAGSKQLHVAETEKYAHVTYFFNGGREEPWDGEERRLVDSRRDVATYDEAPEMSARGVASAFCEAWATGEFRFGVVNFANSDMVGHTGSIPAAVAAVETADQSLAQVVGAVQASGGACIVTADHGNADNMLEPDGSPNTAHSLNRVPCIVTIDGLTLAEDGVLADVAPTVLGLLGIEQPAAMTGHSLIEA